MASLIEANSDNPLSLLESYLNPTFAGLTSLSNSLAGSAASWFPSALQPFLPGAMNTMGRGEVIAAYRNEIGLRLVRDTSRWLSLHNEYALGAIENRVNFIVGSGARHTVIGPAELAKPAQKVIDDFILINLFGEIEQEAVRRTDVDGDFTLRFFYNRDGVTEVRVVEPELITGVYTGGDADPIHSYGIETSPGDVGSWPVAYHIVEDPLRPMTKRVPAEEILFIKGQTNRNAKRGLPILFSITENLQRAEGTLRNFAIMAQIMASFAVLRRHKFAGADAINKFRNDMSEERYHPITGEPIRTQQRNPGGIVDASEQTEYEFPGSGIDVAGYVQTLQADLRALGCRMVMPEYMISGDASNANYGSAMIAEAPSTRMFLKSQQFYAPRFGWRPGPNSGVMYRVLAHAVKRGKLKRETLELCYVKSVFPNLVAKDRSKETQRLKLLRDSGIISQKEWAEAEGYDYDEQVAMGAGGDLGLDLTSVPLVECAATGQPGPCATAPPRVASGEKPGPKPGAKPQVTTLDKLGVSDWPVPDRPGFLDSTGPDGKTYRQMWLDKYGLVDQRPQARDYYDNIRLEVERDAARLFNIPPSDILYDPKSLATVLFGPDISDSGRKSVLAIRMDGSKVSAMRIHPNKTRRMAIEVPDAGDERDYALMRLMGQKISDSRFDSKYTALDAMTESEQKGFSGTIKDSLGRERTYVDGKQVAGSASEPAMDAAEAKELAEKLPASAKEADGSIKSGVVAALKSARAAAFNAATKLSGIAADVLTGAVLPNADEFARNAISRGGDVIMQATGGLDAATAMTIVSHVLAKAITAVKGKKQESASSFSNPVAELLNSVFKGMGMDLTITPEQFEEFYASKIS